MHQVLISNNLFSYFNKFIFRWYKDDVPISWAEKAAKYEKVESFLVILSAQRADAGKFHCTAQNTAGVLEITSKLTVTTHINVRVSHFFLNQKWTIEFNNFYATPLFSI